jgi:hypothetical protein
MRACRMDHRGVLMQGKRIYGYRELADDRLRGRRAHWHTVHRYRQIALPRRGG